jgi:hypothetical protein
MDHYLHDLRSYDEHLHLFPRLRENPARLAELKKQWDYWLALPGFSATGRIRKPGSRPSTKGWRA